VTLALLADENFSGDLVRGLLRQCPDLDLIRVQDTEVAGSPDPHVLAWAAQAGRVILTHDVNTLPGFAYERVRAGLPMPGVIEVSRSTPAGEAIEDILLLAECAAPEEVVDQVRYAPLR
jgi:hypothetical protein